MSSEPDEGFSPADIDQFLDDAPDSEFDGDDEDCHFCCGDEE